VKRFLDDWSGAFEDRNIEVESLHDAGDRVVCVCATKPPARS